MLPKRKARLDCFFLIFQHAGGESPLTIRDWKAGENRYTIGFTRFVTAIYDRPVNNRGESPPTKKRKAFAFLFRVCIDYSM